MDYSFLKQLCQTDAPSGREKPVRELIISRLPSDCTYKTDGLGNLIVEKKGEKAPKSRVAFFAHTDEVGFIVTYIDDDGTVYCSSVGGVEPSALIGKKIRINGCVGSAGLKAVHQCTKEEREKLPEIGEIGIDFGFDSRDEAKKHLELGDSGCFDSDYLDFGGGFIKSKALDDRFGCAVILELLNKKAEYDFTAVFTVQEEVGTRGAAAVAPVVNPDFAVVLEATTAGDIPETPDSKKVCRVGNGAVVSFMDRGTLYDRELYKKAFDIAEKNSIPCQTKTLIAGGNDSSAIHKSAGGIRTLAVSLPCRYIHSASSVCSKKDIEAVEKLADRLLSELSRV